MRIKDIQVGEKYKISYGIGAEVLEKGVERSTYTGKTRRDGVRVKVFTTHRNGAEIIFASQEVKELWKDYEERQSARRLANELRERCYEEGRVKVEAYAAKLNDAGIELKRISNNAWGEDDSKDFAVSIEISSLNLEKIIAALAEPDAKERIAEAEKTQAAQSGSALDAIFAAGN